MECLASEAPGEIVATGNGLQTCYTASLEANLLSKLHVALSDYLTEAFSACTDEFSDAPEFNTMQN